MRTALYARVSTIDKDQDPETQLVKLRAFAQAKGHTDSVEFVDHASGLDPNRQALKEMLSRARKREFEAIVIVRLDRIMRSTKNLLTMIEDLIRWDVALICVDQPIETNTALGRYMITILGATAEFERELIRERVKDGLERAKREGKRLGRRPRKDVSEASAPKFRTYL